MAASAENPVCDVLRQAYDILVVKLLKAYLPEGFIPEYSMESRQSDGEVVFDPDSFYVGDGGLG